MLIRDMSVVMRFEGALMAKDIVQVASERAPLQYYSNQILAARDLTGGAQVVDHYFFEGPKPQIEGLTF